MSFINSLAEKRNDQKTFSITQKALYENVVIITRKTELEELKDRFNTVAQAKFYLEYAGQEFDPIESQNETYQTALNLVRQAIPRGLKSHVIERSYLPQYRFEEADLVITIGPDGLVVNAAKYVDQQPIIAVNPDPAHIDGILMPYTADQMNKTILLSVKGEVKFNQVSMAKASLDNGQSLLAFNDLFIGTRSHVSARYQIQQGDTQEEHSSSGVIISTGAGSTGWLQSVYAGAAGVIKALGGQVIQPANMGRLPWDTDQLIYAVREPFPSKVTQTGMTYGVITREKPLVLSSHMTGNGVIFSDGTENDYLEFNTGSTASISLAEHKVQLVA